jgi:hypothetical protein
MANTGQSQRVKMHGGSIAWVMAECGFGRRMGF